MDREMIPLYVIMAIVAIGFVSFCKQDVDFVSTCKAKGGVVVGGGYSPRNCMKPEYFVDMETK